MRDDPPLAARFVVGGLLVFGAVVVIGLAFGSLHLITRRAYLAADVLTPVAAWILLRRRAAVSAAVDGPRMPAIAVGLWVAIVAFAIGMGLSNSPFTAYDAISYHLFFPARWLQAHRVFIVPTPFSDEAQAYQPGNGELWFLWLMVPLHSDALARIGQLPFYLLGAAATYLIALRGTASYAQAAYAPTLFLIAPPIVEQAVGADVDLIAASTFVSAVWLSLVAIDTGRRRDWILWGCAAGLFVGTKYLAVVYAPILVLIAVLRRPRLRMLWSVPGLLVFGAPWYIRNWIVAGSPLYPATLRIAGLTLGHGAYTHATMLQSFMHTTDPRLLAVSLVHAFGTNMFFVLAPPIALAFVACIARGHWWPGTAVFVAVSGVVALCWLAVGDNTDARFLLPAVALTPALVPLAFRASRRLSRPLHAWLIAGIVWVLVGIDRQIDLRLPWFMADWLPLNGVIDPRFVVVFAALAAIATAVCAAMSRRGRLAASAAVLAIVAGVTMAYGAGRWCSAGLCEYVRVADPHIRLTYLYGVRWLRDHVRNAHVAYAGTNLPYPLSGTDLTNTVSYVNIDNHLSWRFDQYARAFERSEIAVPTPPLAEASGVLMPARGPDAVRPRFERRSGDAEEWKMNLARERIDYLFVTRLDPYEIGYQRHDAQGFPVEDEWAKKDPRAFRTIYSNDDVRIYAVNLAMTDLAR